MFKLIIIVTDIRACEEDGRLLVRCQSVNALLPRQLFIIVLPQHGRQFHLSELARMDIIAIAGITLIIRSGLITN